MKILRMGRLRCRKMSFRRRWLRLSELWVRKLISKSYLKKAGMNRDQLLKMRKDSLR